MKVVKHWCVGLILGLISGALPLLAAQLSGPHVDPFDRGVSYFVWLGGLFAAALGLAYVLPRRTWLWGLAVLSGFVAAMILEIVVDSHTGRATHNLWPLTLMFAVLIGAPPAFAGAYCGAKLKSRK
jgi:hypothetical protein